MDFVEILSSSLGSPALSPNNASNPSNTTTSPASGNPQFALIDFFIPGFSGLSNVVRQYFGIDISLYIPILAVVFGSTFVWGRASAQIWELIDTHLVSSVRVRTDDEIYNIIIAWISKQSFAQRSRKFIANTNINSREYYSYDSDSDSDDEGLDCDEDEDDLDAVIKAPGKQKPLHYTPADGSHYFFFGYNLMLFQRDQGKERSSPWGSNSSREELVISSFGRNPEALKRLLSEARAEYLKKDKDKTIIYRGAAGSFGGDPSWQRCMSRSSRPLSTVILDEKVKKDLINDVNDYLNPATRRWYANRGIPYRRGYLLYGPPGTGKSSLSLALAGHFRMRIYIVSLSSVVANEESLASLFVDLPKKCLVLLEDIDSAGLTHTRDDEDASAANDSVPAQTRMRLGSPDNDDGSSEAGDVPLVPSSSGGGGRLSLSGLLNILDGVASQEGRLLVMTTNHLEKLDKALVRPGRVDRVVHFGLADYDMAASIFRSIYALYDGELDPSAHRQSSALSTSEKTADIAKRKAKEEQEQAETRARVDKLAIQFAEKLPSQEFSPAEVQGLLLIHKRDPEGAIEALPEWVENTRREKKEKEVQEAEQRRKAEEQRAKKKEEENKKKEEEAKEEKKKEEEDKPENEAKEDDS
jgi:chaperone BCS1